MKKTTILCRLIILLMAFAFPLGTFAWTTVTFVSSTNSELNGKKLTKVDNSNFTYELDLTQFTSNPTFKFHVSDDEFDIGNYDNNATIKDFRGNTQYWCSSNGKEDFTLDLNSNTLYNKCTITLKFDNNGGDGHTYWAVTVTGTELKEGVQDPDAYYLVSKELTDGNMRKGFMFSRSRQRNGGPELERYQTLNFQDFLMDSKHKNLSSITYQIVKGDGTVIFAPNTEHNEYELGKKEEESNTKQGNGTVYNNYKCLKPDKNSYFKLNRGLGKSYTFFIDIENKELEILINKEYVGKETIDKGGYYLVGNFNKAAAEIDIIPNSIDGRREMRKSWFKDGIEHLEEFPGADSVLFRATIPKPVEGWSELYLAVFSKTDIENWKKTTDSMSKEEKGNIATTNWANAIRPQVQWIEYDVYNKPNEKSYGLDGTALHGGLFSRMADNTYSNCTQQALNPQVDDSYTSYTFTMNITTSTYNLVFNKGMYIMGPAVSDLNDKDATDTDGWDCSDPDHQTKHALRMYYDQDTRCYYYCGKQPDGTISVDEPETKEQPIHFEAGKKFLFVYNKDFTKTIFQGDKVAPISLIDGDGKSTETQVYRLADNDNENNNKDTQYVNYLRTGNTSSRTYDSEQARACDFGLPTGDYYIRLYIRQDGDMQKIYYILRRKYTFNSPDAEEIDRYNAYKTFCDYHAVVIPKGIDILYVSDKDKVNKTVTLKKYENKIEDGRNILPANTPVILACKIEKDAEEGLVKKEFELNYYEEPRTGYDFQIKGNLLKGQIERKHLEETDGEYANYMFGYRTLNGGDKPTIGFYIPGEGECGINTAYLQLPKDFMDIASQSKGWRIILDSETTSISNPETSTTNEDSNYYTIQGIRTTAPTTKGIYIHKGKKVIIK